jgi:hypothetical protein
LLEAGSSSISQALNSNLENTSKILIESGAIRDVIDGVQQKISNAITTNDMNLIKI